MELEEIRRLKEITGTSHLELAEHLGYKNKENVKWFLRHGTKMSEERQNMMVDYLMSKVNEIKKEVDEKIEISKDSMTVERVLMKDPRDYTPEQLCKEFGIDEKKFELSKFKGNKRTVTHNNGVEAYIEYSGTATFSKKKEADKVAFDEAFATLLKKLNGKLDIELPSVVAGVEDEHFMVIPFFDVHVGKRSECGTHGFEELHNSVLYALRTLLDANTKKLEKIYLCIDGDFLNTDNRAGTTTRGTQQELSDPWDVAFNNAVTLLKDAIFMARGYSEVEVVLCGGNHAHMSTYHVVKCAEAFFNQTDVTFNISTTQRAYIVHGGVLICLSHGDKEGKRIVEAMISEMPEEFGKATIRIIMTGHFHTSGLTESFKILHFKIGSPAVKDKFHSEFGYVGSYRKLESFTFDNKHLKTNNMQFI